MLCLLYLARVSRKSVFFFSLPVSFSLGLIDPGHLKELTLRLSWAVCSFCRVGSFANLTIFDPERGFYCFCPGILSG